MFGIRVRSWVTCLESVAFLSTQIIQRPCQLPHLARVLHAEDAKACNKEAHRLATQAATGTCATCDIAPKWTVTGFQWRSWVSKRAWPSPVRALWEDNKNTDTLNINILLYIVFFFKGGEGNMKNTQNLARRCQVLFDSHPLD